MGDIRFGSVQVHGLVVLQAPVQAAQLMLWETSGLVVYKCMAWLCCVLQDTSSTADGVHNMIARLTKRSKPY